METSPQKYTQDQKQTPENFVGKIRRQTRRLSSSEKKIAIFMEACRGEDSVAANCRRHGIQESMVYKWNDVFLEAGRKRMAGETTWEATSDEVTVVCKENQRLKVTVAELVLRYDRLKNRSGPG